MLYSFLLMVLDSNSTKLIREEPGKHGMQAWRALVRHYRGKDRARGMMLLVARLLYIQTIKHFNIS